MFTLKHAVFPVFLLIHSSPDQPISRAFSTVGATSDATIQLGTDRSSSNTVAHQIIRMEQAALASGDANFDSAAFQAKYDLLDRVLAQARQHISYDPGLTASAQQTAQARRILATIETLLIENNFLLRIPTQYLYEGFTPRPAPQGGYFATSARRQHYQAHQNELFHHFDCDISAVLYVAIAEELGLPIHMVEVPGHNFVRWRFSPSRYLNWDTNAAREYTDDQYRQGLSLTSGTSFGPALEQAERFLTDMTRDEIIGYFTALTAGIFADRKHFAEAVVQYERAIAARPYSTLPRNNLAWMYLVHAEVKSEDNYRRALELALQVDAIDSSDKNYKDTLACAYAAVGDFGHALQAERQAFSKPEKLTGFATGKTCLDLGLT
jgi:tetratricopeptide (TPR) repeat protein